MISGEGTEIGEGERGVNNGEGGGCRGGRGGVSQSLRNSPVSVLCLCS